MSKQHFRALAAALNDVKPADNTGDLEQWRATCDAIAEVCRQFNHRFDGLIWTLQVEGRIDA